MLFLFGNGRYVCAAENDSGLSYTELSAAVAIHLNHGSLTLSESVDCLTARPAIVAKPGGRIVATFFSKPLVMRTGDKLVPVFGGTHPSFSAAGATLGGIRFESEDLTRAGPPQENPDGFYAIDFVFDSPVPERFQINVEYRGNFLASQTVEWVYKLFRQNHKVIYLDRPKSNWGPYELRLDCDDNVSVSLEKGVGWAEPLNGKASIDLQNGEAIVLKLSPM